MAFQIKNFTSIVAAMVNHMRGTQKKITDFNKGSVVRTMMEAVGIELDELYQQMFNGLKEGIPVAVYESFSFALLAAVNSSGMMRLTITASASDTLIPAGTEFVSELNLQRYLSQVDVTIPAASTYADIYLLAESAGSAGNISAISSFTTTANIAGLVSASMLYGFDNGREIETPDERKSRFVSFISTLSRGTVAAIEYGLKSEAYIKNAFAVVTERVVHVSVVEPYRVNPVNPVGWVQVFLHNGIDGGSGGLLAVARNVIDGYTLNGTKIPGWSAAGVQVDIAVATGVPVNVTGTVTAISGYVAADVALGVAEAISDYLLAREIGATVQIDDLYVEAKSVPGVLKFSLTVPAADVTTTTSSKAMPGTIAITPA